jgi:(1->4)-alpha-D-glucan 1-alpha-D-glucosylmutase
MFAPGIPDFYQGTEFFEPTLVDPDNRRSIDFACREKALSDPDIENLETTFGWSALADPEVADRFKLALTARGLRLRQNHPALFTNGQYEPLAVTGVPEGSVLAAARRLSDLTVIAVVPRFAATHCFGDLQRATDIYGRARIEFEGGHQPLDIGPRLSHCPALLFSR